MKEKFHSMDDILDNLNQENVPFENHKSYILEELNKDINKKTYRISKKMAIACTAIILFISITSVAIATEGFGLLRKNVKDKNGNIILEYGITDERKYKEDKDEFESRVYSYKIFSKFYNSIEQQIPDGKFALVIPVKNYNSYLPHSARFFGGNKIFHSHEDMIKSNIKFPEPHYIPKEYSFSKSRMYFYHENMGVCFDEKCNEDLFNKLFNEAKAEGLEYYYKELDVSKDIKTENLKDVFLIYRKKESEELKSEQMNFSELSITISNNKFSIERNIDNVEKREINGREYLVDGLVYNTYIYIDDQLWTVEVCSSFAYKNRDEIISKIVENIK
ncbi:hypothetical protein [Vallitalea maricola]|uniref:Uncharacterized protein n=1 Tax=Vallitalea maricola TaxID=3074433 RepID=A0ACB5UEZ0_9FIRM|nr:hypothetical protein AN2V17_03160 [Vallitalea sp. AN17-2]